MGTVGTQEVGPWPVERRSGRRVQQCSSSHAHARAMRLSLRQDGPCVFPSVALSV